MLWVVFCVFVLGVRSSSEAAPRDKRALYRQLIIKPYPAVENIQSDLYEVYQEPYTFDLRAVQAVASLSGDGDSPVKGDVIFVQRHPPAGPILIRGNITGLAAGKHGLHIHQSGDMRTGCEKLGEHFNPYLMHHGGPMDPIRHVGDLGNIEVPAEGPAQVQLVDPVMALTGIRGVVGRALVITENEDDLGRSGTADSVNNGASGKPVACGIIAYIR